MRAQFLKVSQETFKSERGGTFYSVVTVRSNSSSTYNLHCSTSTTNKTALWNDIVMVSLPHFKRKPPILHRALGGDNVVGKSSNTKKREDNENNEESAEPQFESGGLIAIEDLATKKRVKKRDKFQRNALHVAVCFLNMIVWIVLSYMCCHNGSFRYYIFTNCGSAWISHP